MRDMKVAATRFLEVNVSRILSPVAHFSDQKVNQTKAASLNAGKHRWESSLLELSPLECGSKDVFLRHHEFCLVVLQLLICYCT